VRSLQKNRALREKLLVPTPPSPTSSLDRERRRRSERDGEEEGRNRREEEQQESFNTHKLLKGAPTPSASTIPYHIFDVAGQMGQPSRSSGDPMQHIFT
jgi:hypothetical protein